MLHFFRKIRRDLLANSQFFKYLKYAVGEIILVVLGILIALYINNQNEERKEQEKFDMVLVDVEKELIKNIQSINESMKYYAFHDSLMIKMFIDSVKFENSLNFSTPLRALMEKVPYSDESFQKIKQINYLTHRQESILEDLNRLHVDGRINVNDVENKNQSLVSRISDDMAKYEWYGSLIMSDFEDERIIAFLNNSREYHNMAIQSYAWIRNYRSYLWGFEIQATSTLKKVQSYLDSLDVKRSAFVLKNYDSGDYKYLLGKYESKWCSDNNWVHDDSIAIKIEDGKLIWYGYRSDGPDTRVEVFPINKFRYMDERKGAFYHLEFNDHGEVDEITFSAGPDFILKIEKVR